VESFPINRGIVIHNTGAAILRLENWVGSSGQTNFAASRRSLSLKEWPVNGGILADKVKDHPGTKVVGHGFETLRDMKERRKT